MKLIRQKRKIIFALTSIALCLVLVYSFYSYLVDAEKLRKEVNQNTNNKIRFIQERVEAFFERREILLTSEAAIAESDLGTNEEHNILERLELQYNYLKKEYGIVDIYIGYADGVTESGSDEKANSQSQTWKSYDRPWYIRAVEAPNRIIYTDVYKDIHNGDSMITMAKLLNKNDKKAVLAIDISILQLMKLLENETFGEKGYAFVINQEGRFIIHPEYGMHQQEYEESNTIYSVQDGSLKELGANLINNEMEMFKAAYQGNEKSYLSKKIGNTDFFLVVGIDQREMRTQLNLILMYNVFISIIAVLSYILILMTLTWKIQKKNSKQQKENSNIIPLADDKICHRN